LSGVVTAGLGFSISKILPQAYIGEGSLIVENRPTPNEGQQSPSAVSNVLTQVDVIQARGLLQRVVKELDLVHVPTLMPTSRLPTPITDMIATANDYIQELRQMIKGTTPVADADVDKTINYVQRHLGAANKDSSSVITVQFEAGSPTTAALVTNAVMQTYLDTIAEARLSQITKADAWIALQIDLHRTDLTNAENAVTQFVKTHQTTEVQGSQTTAIQLSEHQKQLVLAREDLARKEAAVRTVNKGNIAEAEEIQGSKTIQTYKELEAKTMEQMQILPIGDPRRQPLQAGLAAVRSQIAYEQNLIIAGLSRSAAVARANVDELQRVIKEESIRAQTSTVDSSTLKQLTGTVEAKRQLLISFTQIAGQVRVAAEQSPFAHILFQAVPPEKPIRAYDIMSIIIGFVAGIAGSSGFMVMRSLMRPKINSGEEMTAFTGLPVIGVLPEVGRSRNLSAPRTKAQVTETFRGMWLSMRPENGNGSAILVTSGEVGEGKTTVAMGLASRFAADGYRVLLIDADLRHPGIAKLLGIRPEHTLVSVLEFRALLQNAVVTAQSIDFLLTDGRVSNPLKILASDALPILVEEARRNYDFVILDGPPVLQVVDPILLAKMCQHIMFIVQAGHLSIDMVVEAMHRFDELDRPKMHTVLTRVHRRLVDHHGSYGGYGTK
jgi:capsular exopolysaccharide synthesis family protein